MIQLSPLLYKVAEAADGRRDLAAIAEAVGADIGRHVTADNVRVLVDEKLRPLGVLTARDGSSPAVRKLDPLLALKFRFAVVPEGAAVVIGRLFRPLFWLPVVLAVLVALVAVDGWLFFSHGVAQATRQTLYSPATFLVLFGAVVLSAGFHEVGHATGCLYGGARPGRMGCGLYLAWPAFYTDVTDAYRLGRAGRLRTDLGGVYFNAIVVLLTVGLYAATGWEPLLLLAVVQHIEIAHQLLPVVRLDGYYIVADLTGVPDLFARIRPILVSAIPGRTPDERVSVLKPWVRAVVTVWVLVVVPLLVFQLIVIAAHLPRILGTAWDSGSKLLGDMTDAFGSGDLAGGASAALQLVVLALPIAGIVLMFARLGRRSAAFVWRKTDGRPAARAIAVAVVATLGLLVLSSWLPGEGRYRPIRGDERGTVVEGVRGVTRVGEVAGATVADAEEGTTPTSTPATTTTTTAAGDEDETTATTVDETTDTTTSDETAEDTTATTVDTSTETTAP